MSVCRLRRLALFRKFQAITHKFEIFTMQKYMAYLPLCLPLHFFVILYIFSQEEKAELGDIDTDLYSDVPLASEDEEDTTPIQDSDDCNCSV